MDNKAQGALEYLLLMAGAIIVAAIVIVMLGDITGSTGHKTKNKLNDWLTHLD